MGVGVRQAGCGSRYGFEIGVAIEARIGVQIGAGVWVCGYALEATVRVVDIARVRGRVTKL